MVDKLSLLLILCLVAILGLGVPVSIYLAAKHGEGVEQIELAKRAMARARNPWQPEDESLDELAKRVEGLRPKSDKET